MPEVSILIGAGFSMPKGYPSGKKLNDLISSFDPLKWGVGSAYELLHRENEGPAMSGHEVLKFILHDLIRIFCSRSSFDYEEFYDFLSRPMESMLRDLYLEWYEKFSVRHRIEALDQLVNNTKAIYNKLISIYIKDQDGNQYYESVHYGKPYYNGYTNFLNLLENLVDKNDVVHVHSLNHDLLFETFNDTDWIFDKLCDGFEELGSPYYGEVKGVKKISHKVRLPYYTNVFKKKVRLYKLHGSVNYMPFHREDGILEAFLKIYPGIAFEHLFQEMNDESGLRYHNDWSNLHADFLSGTTSKIIRYRSKIYYSQIFDHFERNLKNSESLIIIGYGCKDPEINRILSANFKGKAWVLDPTPNDKTRSLSEDLEGFLIKKIG
jgi:hypothetical protein